MRHLQVLATNLEVQRLMSKDVTLQANFSRQDQAFGFGCRRGDRLSSL